MLITSSPCLVCALFCCAARSRAGALHDGKERPEGAAACLPTVESECMPVGPATNFALLLFRLLFFRPIAFLLPSSLAWDLTVLLLLLLLLAASSAVAAEPRQ